MITIELQQCIFKWQAQHNQRMSYAQLAKLVGVHYAVIQRFPESQYLNLEVADKICEVLECTLDELVVYKRDKT